MTEHNVIAPYILSRHGVIWLATTETSRALKIIESARQNLKVTRKLPNGTTIEEERRLFTWKHNTGLTLNYGSEEESKKFNDPELQQETQNLVAALRHIMEFQKDAIFVLDHIGPFVESPMVAAALREAASIFPFTRVKQLDGQKAGNNKSDGRNGDPICRIIIAVGPRPRLTEALYPYIPVVDLPLPDIDTISKELGNVFAKGDNTEVAGGPDEVKMLTEACMGLALHEISDTIFFALAAKKLDPEGPTVRDMVIAHKAELIRRTGVLEICESPVSMKDIGGLDSMKAWLQIRAGIFSPEAKAFGLSAPRGVLVTGIPGCGKSLIAKAIATMYKITLIRFDIGKIFGGLVGQSEENMRNAISSVESQRQCVLWVDEIDKAFSGMMSQYNGDSGVSQRIFGSFITWLQEKKADVFVVATANRIAGLPPELLRKGRFDQIFFVGLPTRAEREAIFTIHIHKRRPLMNLDVAKLAKATEGFSGAEIEETVVSAMYDAFHKKTDLNEELILYAASRTIPLSKSRSDDVEQLTKWAASNAINASVDTSDITLDRNQTFTELSSR